MSDGSGSGTHRIYLAGPVERDDNPRTWRDEVKDAHPGPEWIDPMDWQGEWESDPTTVWERELETCRNAGVLVCNIGTDAPRTTGTHHEIRVALDHGQPVAIVPTGTVSQIYREVEDVAVFGTVEDTVAHLTKRPLAADGGRNTDDELEEAVHWVERELREARRALWDGKSGKAFASIEAAQDEFQTVEEAILDG